MISQPRSRSGRAFAGVRASARHLIASLPQLPHERQSNESGRARDKRLRDRLRRRAIIGFGTGQAALLAPMLTLERRMKRTGGPGIIPLELAGTTARTDQILRVWGRDGTAAARTSLILDYPYLITYAGLQAALCDLAGEKLLQRGRRRLAQAGNVISIMQWGAGLFDAIENAALLAVLAGRDGRLPAVARNAACVKFGLLGVGWAYMAAGLRSYLESR